MKEDAMPIPQLLVRLCLYAPFPFPAQAEDLGHLHVDPHDPIPSTIQDWRVEY